ncbi:pimeloyl-ACP methyl ester carboxylesterase [Streptacidiphilus sp. MAP12-20]|uniref:alpha/beta fold hydrolase n=1 Tax=Streptacidiphilus sp. MAP12-20 TaxID=3156299 RepID=UPI0035175C33
MSLLDTRPLTAGSLPLPPAVQSHTWNGFPCESRLVRTTAPELPPLLMIGGAFQSKESWGRFERLFLRRMDVVTVDPPGWGAGGVLPEQHGADLLADAICHMLSRIGLDRVNIMSGSYGTALAYRIAQLHPHRVGRMVLVGTMTSIPEHARVAMRRTLDHLRQGRMEEFADESLGILMNAERQDQVVASTRVRRFLRRRMINLSGTERAQSLANTERLLTHDMLDPTLPPAAPVLAVTGEHDTFTTPDRCRQLAETCLDSHFAVVSEADHMLFLERMEETADLTTRFLMGKPLDGLGYTKHVERVRTPLRAPLRPPGEGS